MALTPMNDTSLEFSMNCIKMVKALIFSFVVCLGSLSLSGQSQNMRFSEIVWRATNSYGQDISYTVPQGYVFKMTSFALNSRFGGDSKLKVNGFIISEGQSGTGWYESSAGYNTNSTSCEIWFNGGDLIEMITLPTNEPVRLHFSGILYELY